MSYIGRGLEYGQSESFIFTASGSETSVTTVDDGRTVSYNVGLLMYTLMVSDLSRDQTILQQLEVLLLDWQHSQRVTLLRLLLITLSVELTQFPNKTVDLFMVQ